MDNSKIKILVVDDAQDIRELLEILLQGEGFEVAMASSGQEAIEKVDEGADLILLDVAMPGKNGFITCRELREKTMAPILFLTAKTQESDKVMGFSAGGDDYISKPFSNAELLSRIKAVLRRCYVYRPLEKEGQCQRLRSGELLVDTVTKNVSVGGEEVTLTPIEYDLLELMMKYPKKVFSAQNLYESVWKENYTYTENNTIVVHISNLRRKIEQDPKKPKYIKSMWGRGYYADI